MLDPVTGIMLFVLGGVGAVAATTTFAKAQKLGPKLEVSDLLPMLPPYPPVPRFLFSKPEPIEELRRR